MTKEATYDLPSSPAGTAIEMTIDGVPYSLERIQIDELPEYRARHNLQPIRPIGGPNTWPPAILYHPTPSVGAQHAAPSQGDPHDPA